MPFERADDEVEIEVEVLMQTDKAYRVKAALTEVDSWVPKSQVLDVDEDDKGRITSIFVRRWLAERHGLV